MPVLAVVAGAFAAATAVGTGAGARKDGSGSQHEQYFIWGYYGTQYRVRLYPAFGYSIL